MTCANIALSYQKAIFGTQCIGPVMPVEQIHVKECVNKEFIVGMTVGKEHIFMVSRESGLEFVLSTRGME